MTRLLLTMASLAAVVSGQSTWSLTADWSDVANPNGVWSYREGENLLGGVPAWNPSFWSPQPAWANSASYSPDFTPAWFKLVSPLPFVDPNFDGLPGDVVIHTKDPTSTGSGEGSVVWTSPISGTVDIGGGVWETYDPFLRADDFLISKNGVLLTSGSISGVDVYDRASPHLFSLGSGGPGVLQGIPVVPGDQIRLELVHAPPVGGCDCGSFVGVSFIVTTSGTIPAGQLNSPAASLVINGVGSGFGFPPYFVPVAGGGTLDMVWSGPPLSPVALLAGSYNPGNLMLPCIGSLDIGMPPLYPDLVLVFDGFGAPYPASLFFSLGSAGTLGQTVSLPLLPAGFVTSLQGIVFQPAGSPCPFVLTAAMVVVSN